VGKLMSREGGVASRARRLDLHPVTRGVAIEEGQHARPKGRLLTAERIFMDSHAVSHVLASMPPSTRMIEPVM